MNVYLQMAEKILRSHKKPMSAKAILKEAYLRDIAPVHIYGKTQHKTLQARLSEDIVRHKEKSLFCRTKPGFFFLKEFMEEASIFHSRRRKRDLRRGNLLSLKGKKCFEQLNKSDFIGVGLLEKIMTEGAYEYKPAKKISSSDVIVLAAAYLIKNYKILSYREGRYRDGRDNFTGKRSVLFRSAVTAGMETLFGNQDMGLINTASSALSLDLNISISDIFSYNDHIEEHLKFFVEVPESLGGERALLAYIEFHAPNWFEPIDRKLSLNNLDWLDLTVKPNNLEGFDPYSQIFLSYYFSKGISNGV